jgi:hypothetical protein
MAPSWTNPPHAVKRPVSEQSANDGGSLPHTGGEANQICCWHARQYSTGAVKRFDGIEVMDTEKVSESYQPFPRQHLSFSGRILFPQTLCKSGRSLESLRALANERQSRLGFN